MPNQPILSADQIVSSLKGSFPDPYSDIDIGAEGGDGRVHAAVAVILRGTEDPEVLLIKRAEREGDPWSGQMALPGGRRDGTDPSLLGTAIRETEEETAVPLAKVGVALGRMEGMDPSTRRLPAITIFPFVFQVPEDTKAVPDSQEVDETLWVPLSTFTGPDNAGFVDIHVGDGATRPFPCWRVEGRVVWGLTHRILTRFLGRLSGTKGP